jgi:hypothetical protein
LNGECGDFRSVGCIPPLEMAAIFRRIFLGQAVVAAWRASWNVFRAALIMFNICSLVSLETYARQVEKLNTQWPRCWGLIYMADDGARAERLEKIRRRLTIESAHNRQVPRDWDPMKPWSCVFTQLAGDLEWGRGAPTVASEASMLVP